MASPVPIPETVKGTPMIATNRKIRLTILDKPDYIFEKNIAGYVVVDMYFYDLLIKTYKARNER